MMAGVKGGRDTLGGETTGGNTGLGECVRGGGGGGRDGLWGVYPSN